MQSWGEMRLEPVHLVMPEDTPQRQKRAALAAYDGVALPEPKPVWRHGVQQAPGAQVGEERLWFNAAMDIADTADKPDAQEHREHRGRSGAVGQTGDGAHA